MTNTSTDGTDFPIIDREIPRRAHDAPGIAQSQIVRDLQRQWSPSNIRQRIDLLAARGIIRTERRNGRIFVYPAEAIPMPDDDQGEDGERLEEPTS